MNIISVLNQKGGCGKTITAVNLAAALSKKNHSVLLLDLDPQGHATFSLGAHPANTLTDIFEKFIQGQTIVPDEMFITIAKDFSLIGSSIGLASLEHKLSSHPDKLRVLTAFSKACLSGFEYVVVDCPPNLGLLTLNSLVASKYALIPLMACDFSLNGVEILKNILIMVKEFSGSAPAPFFLLNQVDNRSNFSRQFGEKITKQLGKLLLSSKIRTNIHLREAASKGKNIFDYMPKSRGAEDFMNLANEIEGLTAQGGWVPLFVKAKDLNEVFVVGDFNNWQVTDTYKLHRVGSDIWSINLFLGKGTYRYKFVAQDRWFTDPYNKLAENDQFGGKNSLLVSE